MNDGQIVRPKNIWTEDQYQQACRGNIPSKLFEAMFTCDKFISFFHVETYMYLSKQMF